MKFYANVSTKTSRELKVMGAIGPCVSMKKNNGSVSDTVRSFIDNERGGF